MSKTLILTVLLGAAALAGVLYSTQGQNSSFLRTTELKYKNQFLRFKQHYGKTYGSDEGFFRYQQYASNMDIINAHNTQYDAGNSTFFLGENELTDLSLPEFKQIYLGYKRTTTKRSLTNVKVSVSNETLPVEVDWVKKGAVNAVKNQQQCGSCWAFSAVGALESLNFLKNGKLQSFSEQSVVDCSGSYGNQGCNGGLMDQAFQYVIDNGITSEDNYPYTAETDSCNDAATKDIAYQISSFKDIPSGDCDSLTSAVNQQPVAIGVDAESWQFYSGGVFSDCGDQLDHGVLAVGYDDSSNWIVKNSWGNGWGESGYITLATGNTCGICNTASIPQK